MSGPAAIAASLATLTSMISDTCAQPRAYQSADLGNITLGYVSRGARVETTGVLYSDANELYALVSPMSAMPALFIDGRALPAEFQQKLKLQCAPARAYPPPCPVKIRGEVTQVDGHRGIAVHTVEMQKPEQNK